MYGKKLAGNPRQQRFGSMVAVHGSSVTSLAHRPGAANASGPIGAFAAASTGMNPPDATPTLSRAIADKFTALNPPRSLYDITEGSAIRYPKHGR